MTTQRNDYSARDFEREAQTTRRRLADDLDELSSRLTPGQVMDEMLSYARGGGMDFGRAFASAARHNPIPTLLIGAGCALFLSDKLGLSRLAADGMRSRLNGRSRPADGGRWTDAGAGAVAGASDSMRKGARRTADYVGDKVSEATDGMRRSAQAAGDAIGSATDSMRRTMHDVGDQVSSAAESTMERVREFGGSVQSSAAALGEQVADGAQTGAAYAQRAAASMRERASSFATEQPLLVAALGLAVGAVIAASLPRTETEDELMGEASDAVKDAVTGVASEQVETARQAAGRVLQEAKQAAEEQGLTPAGAAAAVRELGDRVAGVAGRTSEAAQAEARDLSGQRSSQS